MALASLTLSTQSKCIYFVRNQADISGVDAGVLYIYIDKIEIVSILSDGIMVTFDNNKKTLLPTDQVETVGTTTHAGGFPTTAAFETALTALLDL